MSKNERNKKEMKDRSMKIGAISFPLLISLVQSHPQGLDDEKTSFAFMRSTNEKMPARVTRLVPRKQKQRLSQNSCFTSLEGMKEQGENYLVN